MRPLVTIVTPSYNQGRFIRTAIESVLTQDYRHIQYIVMDGGSTDETASVVKDYASRLTWISERDLGQSHAINKGFRLAKGSIVSWLNSDDWILPRAVSHAVAGFAREPEAGAVYGDGILADRDGKITGPFPWTEPPNLWKLVHLSDYILQQTVYFRRDVLNEVGELREDLRYTMDWDILIRIAKRYPLHYIPESMGCLREYAEAKSFSGGRERLREIARVLREHTGERFPPGYLLYALNTYRKILCEPIRKPRVHWLLNSAFGYAIHRLMQSQGWRDDQSAGPRVKYMLPAGPARSLVLSGSTRVEQQLRIFAGGREIARRDLNRGDFEWRLEIPAADQPLDLLFRSSSKFLLRSVRAEMGLHCTLDSAAVWSAPPFESSLRPL